MAIRKYFWLALNLVITLGLIAVAVAIFFFRQEIFDWWALKNYNPPAKVVQLAERTTMHGNGRDLFYISAPEVLAGKEFNSHCSNTSEESAVLGCYAMGRIYIFDIKDARLNGVEEVTAAHEMLHAAYERLDPPVRENLDKMLQSAMDELKNDEHLNSLIKTYNKSEPGQLLNEMHSILGTEYRNLTPGLETYYEQYFTNRKKVVAYAENYQALFTASKQRIAALKEQLQQLKAQIDANNLELESRQAQLDQKSAELDSLRNQDPEAYNRAVPDYNQQAREFNDLAAAAGDLTAQYNDLVNQYNREAAAQGELYQSLDSKYQPVKAD